MFVLYADKNKLTVRKREAITSGSANVYEVRFEFSSDWDGLKKTAVFESGEVSKSWLLDDTGLCTIPPEVLTDHGRQLTAGVYGTLDGRIVLPTIRANMGIILEGIPAPDGEVPPTPELWEQALAGKADGLDYDGKTLSLMSGEKMLDSVDIAGGGEGGPDLPTIKDTFVDNISYFDGIDLPCCVHCVNVVLGYTFHDDILYVSRDNDTLTVVTMDNATVLMSIDNDTGELDIAKTQRLEVRLEGIESDIEQLQQSGGGGTTWGVGHGLKVVDGNLAVNSVDNFEGDNTLPMTAAGVQATVGNIEALLGTI